MVETQQTSANDVRFNVAKWPASSTAWSSIVSTLAVLSYNVEHASRRDEALKHIIRWRRYRLSQLCDAGFERVADPRKLMYARNCPPCAVVLRDNESRHCHLRFCPFCHARRVEAIFSTLLATSKVLAAEHIPHQAVSLITRHADVRNDVIYMVAGQLTPYFQDVVLNARHRDWNKRLRSASLANAYLGYAWYSLEPVVSRTRSLFGTVGHWAARHGTVALVPTGWEAGRVNAHIRILEKISNRRLALLVAKTFRYPRLWMRGGQANTSLVAQMFNIMRRVRTFSKFGERFRNHGI